MEKFQTGTKFLPITDSHCMLPAKELSLTIIFLTMSYKYAVLGDFFCMFRIGGSVVIKKNRMQIFVIVHRNRKSQFWASSNPKDAGATRSLWSRSRKVGCGSGSASDTDVQQKQNGLKVHLFKSDRNRNILSYFLLTFHNLTFKMA
jgi:hypothetical protein